MISVALLALGIPVPSQDPVIGEVLGAPVHASQVQGSSTQERSGSLRSLLIAPAIKAYLEPHKKEWSLSEAEISAITRSYKSLAKCRPELHLRPMAPPFDKLFAVMIGGNTKIQRFIYLNHGGGRILFQQAGAEAFDATRNLVLQLEQEGKFEFFNPADRELALSYWTRENQSPLLPDPGPDQAFKLDSLLMECP